jgi:hypothetical protein
MIDMGSVFCNGFLFQKKRTIDIPGKTEDLRSVIWKARRQYIRTINFRVNWKEHLWHNFICICICALLWESLILTG